MPIHSSLRKYFWDINPKKARPKSHPEYYIKRVLELGDQQALSWLKRTFGKKKIRQIAQKAKLSPKSANYWKLLFK